MEGARLEDRPDPRKAKTLGEACSNGDGTYNGFALLSWLSECVCPGKGVSIEEVREMYRNQPITKKEGEHGRTGNTGSP